MRIKNVPGSPFYKAKKCPLTLGKGSSERARELAGAGKEGDLVTERQRREENGAMIIGDEVGDHGTEFSVRAWSRCGGDRGLKAVRRCGCGQRVDN